MGTKLGNESPVSFKDNLHKYFRYVYKNDGFSQRAKRGFISSQAFESARSIRGLDRPPAIIIHGIMKRSGTVYTGELLGTHPQIHPHPNKMWETPFLSLTGDIRKLQKNYSFAYRFNADKIGENDFLPLFGSSFIAYMYSLIPEGQRMLLKVPGVEYLDYFYDVFPGENLLLLTRDGRDLVASTIKTWPQLRFSDVCRRWALSARMVLNFEAANAGKEGYWMASFEDAVKDPQSFLREASTHFNLSIDDFPLEQIETLPVIGSSTTRKEGKTWIKRTSSFNPIGRWTQWSPWRKMIFKRIAGQELIDLGYSENQDW